MPKEVIEIIVQYAGKNRLESFVENPLHGSSIWNVCTPWQDPDAVDACIAHGITTALDKFYFSQNPMAISFLRENHSYIHPRGLYFNPCGHELYSELVASKIIVPEDESLYRRSGIPYDPNTIYDRSGMGKIYQKKHNYPDIYRLILEINEKLREIVTIVLGNS